MTSRINSPVLLCRIEEHQDELTVLLLTYLKGLSHEIFGSIFWAVWMYLDLNVNPLWFLNFNDAPLILDNYFKFLRISGQTFSEILRISKKDWQLRT